LREWLRTAGEVRARVTSTALAHGDELAGRVTGQGAVSSMVGRNVVLGPGPRADSDRRVVEVRVTLDEKDAALAAHGVGLEVEVELLPPAGPSLDPRRSSP
jgi:hypothetical protein